MFEAPGCMNEFRLKLREIDLINIFPHCCKNNFGKEKLISMNINFQQFLEPEKG